MEEPIYVYNFLELDEHRIGVEPTKNDFQSIGSGLLEVVKIYDGKVFDALGNGLWVEVEGV
jgi:hypothetical protein